MKKFFIDTQFAITVIVLAGVFFIAREHKTLRLEPGWEKDFPIVERKRTKSCSCHIYEVDPPRAVALRGWYEERQRSKPSNELRKVKE